MRAVEAARMNPQQSVTLVSYEYIVYKVFEVN